MRHSAIDQVLRRVKRQSPNPTLRTFSPFYWRRKPLRRPSRWGWSRRLVTISDDKDRNRYRLEHLLVRSEGLGDWGRALEDALTGPASQYLLVEARTEQAELIASCRQGDWQYEAVSALKRALVHLGIEAEEVPGRSDLKRRFRLFATLRNKTRRLLRPISRSLSAFRLLRVCLERRS